MDLSSPDIQAFISIARETARAGRESRIEYVDTESNLSSICLKRNTVVFGRRGSGKTTLLAELGKRDQKQNCVIWVDTDTYKNLTFPDTLIQIFRLITLELCRSIQVSAPWWRVWARPSEKKKTTKKLEGLEAEFRELLERFDEAQVTVSDEDSQIERTQREAGLQSKIKVSSGSASESASSMKRAASGLERKTQLIDRKMQDFRLAFKEGVDTLERTVHIVLDDFYHLRVDDQAQVLDYMAQLVKNTNCYLKFSSISHRTSLYKSGTTVQGLQLGHDVHDINLDRSFKNFESVDGFLSQLLKQLSEKASAGIQIKDLFNDASWRQLVLSSGGVPRDFLNILVKTIELGRQKTVQGRLDQRLVNEAANLYYRETKQQDLKTDARDTTQILEWMLKDIRDFCVIDRKKNVFLIAIDDFEQHPLCDEAIKQLCDFRFIHEIHDNSSRPGTTSRFRAYLLDVGVYAYPERRGDNRVEEVAFWEKDEKSRLDELRSSPVYRFKDDYSVVDSGPFDEPSHIDQSVDQSQESENVSKPDDDKRNNYDLFPN